MDDENIKQLVCLPLYQMDAFMDSDVLQAYSSFL